jgi:hypothetical protein
MICRTFHFTRGSWRGVFPCLASSVVVLLSLELAQLKETFHITERMGKKVANFEDSSTDLVI